MNRDRSAPDHHPDMSTAPDVGLVVASAVAPGTFAPSLSSRSALDQGLVTGLSTGLHYLLAAGAQDAIEATARFLVDGSSSPAARRTATIAVDAAAVPLGLAALRAFPPRAEDPLRGAVRQAAWRTAPRSGSSARGGNARSTASPRGTAAASTAIVAVRRAAGDDVPSTRNRAVAPSASCAPAARRKCSPVASPVTSPWSRAVRADSDGANVPGAVAAARTRPTSGALLVVPDHPRLRRPARPMAGSWRSDVPGGSSSR